MDENSSHQWVSEQEDDFEEILWKMENKDQYRRGGVWKIFPIEIQRIQNMWGKVEW